MKNKRLIDMSGQRYGRLVAMEQAGNAKSGAALWRCKCDCGREKVVTGVDLRNGHVASCGCLHSEGLSERNRTHGGSGTRLHTIWTGMKQRCGYLNATNYGNYGGRGITVCQEWLDSFEVFQDWAFSNGYRDDLTLERSDNDGAYCPENCRWATRDEQANNRRHNHRITHNGETHTVREWAEILGIPAERIRCRVRRGMEPEQILYGGNGNYRMITANGETHSIKEWAAIIGIAPSTISHRIKNGWPEQKAVTEKGGK